MLVKQFYIGMYFSAGTAEREGAKDERVSIHKLGGFGAMHPQVNFEICAP